MKLAKANIDGNVFYYKKDDIYIGKNVVGGSYEPYFTKLLLRNIGLGDTVFDVGANIGFDTINMAKKVGPRGRVFAIEPEGDNFEILKKNIATNKLDNVILIKAALGEKDRQIKLYKSRENYGDHKVYNDGSKRLTEIVEVKMLDNLVKEYEINKISLIKSDTQGYEPAVFSGGKNTLKRDRPILFFEYWPGGYKKAGLSGEKMLSLLEGIYGDNLFFIDEYIQVYYKRNMNEVNEMLGEENHCNLWAIKNAGLIEKWGQVRDFWLKKFIKRGLGVYPLT